MIYFIRPVGEKGPVKIGCSVDPVKRLAAFQAGCPIHLELIATMESVPSLERALQHKFAADHQHGEWFAWSPRLAALIDQHAIPAIQGPLCDLPPRGWAATTGMGRVGYDLANDLVPEESA